MHTPFWQIIAATPWWEYAFYISIIYIGWQGRHSSEATVSRKKLLIPLFLLCLTVLFLFLSPFFLPLKIIVFVIALLIGQLLSRLQLYLTKVTVDPANKTISIPGGWSRLVIAILLVAGMFYNKMQIITPPTTIEAAITPSTFVVLGLLTGWFLGQHYYIYRRLRA